MKVGNITKKLLWGLGTIVLVLGVVIWIMKRDYWYALSKINNDEGGEIKVLGFRRYPQANGYTDAWITLEDGRDVQLFDLDRGRKFAGFANGRLYTAKLVNDDFVFREVREATDSSK